MASAAATSGNEGGKSRRKSFLRWYIIGGVILLLVGLLAGAGLWRMQNVAPETGKNVVATRASEGQSLLPIGRITVNVTATPGFGDKRTRFLVIEPTLLYASTYDEVKGPKGMAEQVPALRDSFIEFLSQLHEDDVYGSAGLAELRYELLRRARLVINDDAPIAVLLQDFVLQ